MSIRWNMVNEYIALEVAWDAMEKMLYASRQANLSSAPGDPFFVNSARVQMEMYNRMINLEAKMTFDEKQECFIRNNSFRDEMKAK